MSGSVISPRDQELLSTASALIAKLPQALCPDFHQFLDEQSYPQPALLRHSFENLLLVDHESIVNAIQLDASVDAKLLVALFDRYLECMGRRIPSVLEDQKQARIALESLRRLAFALMQKILANQKKPSMQPERKPSRKSDVIFENVMSQDQFVFASNQLLLSPETRNIAILAVQFDFGMHSNNAVQPVLTEIAARLNQIARTHDFVTHISTRRWALCLQHIDNLAIAMLAIDKLMEQFKQPFVINGIDTVVRPQIGVALSKNISKDADFLLHAALKVSAIATRHPHHYQVYDPELDAEAKRMDRLSIQLKKALFDNELELYYQPKYSLKGSKIVGLEALLRWQADEGLVPIPLIFNLIERDGLLNQFTQWLLQTAFRHLIDFLHRGMDISLSVNILPQNLNEPDFSTSLANMLNIWKVPRDRLTIEITEGSLLDDTEETIDALKQIREMGLRISMDDFGTGYSSLSYLSRLPIHEIKIDQAFVKNMFASERDEAIVRTIIELGNNFRLDFVAEGVEDEATAEKLAALGCDILQGFWISKPISHSELMAWFENDKTNVWQHLPFNS
ncbi:MAG: GGDEF domain-containing phosphodiesterase [Nitrosomonadales bacterium]|nr:GGDEF domain-containing phosphodiesterase [Nitrosomonadales bacterium]